MNEHAIPNRAADEWAYEPGTAIERQINEHAIPNRGADEWAWARHSQ